MRLNQLQTLRGLDDIPTLEPKQKPMKQYFSSIDILCYSVNLCYLSMKIIRGEMFVKNKYETLNAMINESKRTLHPDFIYEGYTEAKAKKFYKSVGLNKKHLETR